MIRHMLANGLLVIARLEEGFADVLDAAGPPEKYPPDHPARKHQERADRLRISALELRHAAIGIMIGRAKPW